MDVFSLVATLELQADNFFSGLAGAAKAMVDFAADSVKTGAEFDYTMSGVRAVMGEFSGDINGLIKQADEMGLSYVRGANDAETAFNILRSKALDSSKQTRYTAEETAEALHYMGMAGWEYGEALSALDGVMELAAAGNMDVGRTSDIVTDALTAFHKPASEAGHLVDVLATAAAKSNTNVTMLGESFKYVAPLAGELGYSFEDVGLALGIMANSGIKSGMAGRAMRNFLTNLASLPTEKIQAAAAELGVSLSDTEGHLLSLREVMNALRGAGASLESEGFSSSGLSKWVEDFSDTFGKKSPERSALSNVVKDLREEKIGWKEAYYEIQELIGDKFTLENQSDFFKAANVFTETGLEKLIDLTYKLGGKQALPGLLAIVSASEEDFNALADALDNSAGAGERMQKTMLENLQGDLYKFNSAADVLRVAISDKLTPTVREFVEYGTQGINDITEAFQTGGVEALPGAIEQFMTGAVGLIESHASEWQKTGETILNAISHGMEAAAPVIGEVVSTLGTMAAKFLSDNAGTIASVTSSLVKAFVPAGLAIIQGIGAGIVEAWPEISSALSNLFGELTPQIQDWLRTNIPVVGNFLADILQQGQTERQVQQALSNENLFAPQADASLSVWERLGNAWNQFLANNQAASAAMAETDFPTEEAQEYIDKLGEVPDDVTTNTTADTSGAISAVNSLIEAINSIPTDVTVNVSGNYTGADPNGISDARSMSGGTILRGATMFGWDAQGRPHIGGGEGPEAVVGVNSLDRMIQNSVANAVSGIVSGVNALVAGGRNQQPAQLVLDTGVLVAAIAPSLDSEMSRITNWRHGGDR